jgi:hypothetical protein
MVIERKTSNNTKTSYLADIETRRGKDTLLRCPSGDIGRYVWFTGGCGYPAENGERNGWKVVKAKDSVSRKDRHESRLGGFS